MALEDQIDDDVATLDRGDDLEAKEPESKEPDPKDVEEVEAEAKKLTTPEEDQPRDSTGKFAKKDHDDARVPKARFDEAVGKERAAREAAEARARDLVLGVRGVRARDLRRRAVELEQMVRKESRTEAVSKAEEAIEALEAKHTKLILDGEHEAAAKVMKEIRHAERQIATSENNEKLGRATSQAVEQVRMEAAIARLESDHPALNQESEVYDQDLVDLVLAEQARLIRELGKTPSAALTDAATKIMRKFGAAQPVKDMPEAKGLAAAKEASSRKADQVAKNLETDRKQPAKGTSGMDSDKAGMKDSLPDLDKLTPEEFEALPASAKAKMRGDFV